MFWIGLIVGLVIGSFMGILLEALCVAAKMGDQHYDI